MKRSNHGAPTVGDAAIGVLALITCGAIAAQTALLPRSASLVTIAACALGMMFGCWRVRRSVSIVGIVGIGLLTVPLTLSVREVSTAASALGALMVALPGLAAIYTTATVRTAYDGVREQHKIVQALTQIDIATGVLKSTAGRDRLRTETARAVRYRRIFSVLVGKPSDWLAEEERRGIAAAESAYEQSLRVMLSLLRDTDSVTADGDHTFFAILIETPATGGETTMRRIQDALRAEGLIEMRFGLVQFPDDGVTDEVLLREAFDALAFAEMANLPVASRRALVAAIRWPPSHEPR